MTNLFAKVNNKFNDQSVHRLTDNGLPYYREINNSPDLSKTAKAVMRVLVHSANQSTRIFRTNRAYILKTVQCSTASFTRAVKALKQKGWLVTIHKRRRYYYHIQWSNIVAAPGEKVGHHSDQAEHQNDDLLSEVGHQVDHQNDDLHYKVGHQNDDLLSSQPLGFSKDCEDSSLYRYVQVQRLGIGSTYKHGSDQVCTDPEHSSFSRRVSVSVHSTLKEKKRN